MKANYGGTKFAQLSPSEQLRMSRTAGEIAYQIAQEQRQKDFDKLLDISVMAAVLTLNEMGYGQKRILRFLQKYEETILAHGGYGEALAEALRKHLIDRGIDVSEGKWKGAVVFGEQLGEIERLKKENAELRRKLLDNVFCRR